MKKLKERVIKNWMSSVIGIVIIAVCSYCLIIGKITGSNYLLILPVAISLLGVKDSILGKKV